ncbi:hypothetical protein P606_05090 [Comamonas thiooxydans]|nr:hypothetical protein P606_05090 [Comamonas thiooxydans]
MQQRRNNAAARVVGRVSLFLEGLKPDSELENLQAENRMLQDKVADLERKLDADNSQDRLDSILNNISAQVTKYVDKLEGEFKIYPARFDLKNLTVTFDRVERSIPMSKSGGGENHLAYHC